MPGNCNELIECIIDKLPELSKSELATRMAILGLLPSILIIIAPQPEDLVKLALVSSLRAVALAAFSIGISLSMFSRLSPDGRMLAEERERV